MQLLCLLYTTIYVSCPTPRYQLENSPPKQKLTEEKLALILKMLKSVSTGERVRYQDNVFTALEQRLCKQEPFVTCLQWFVEVVLQRSDVVNVCKQGSFSAKELVAIFKVSVGVPGLLCFICFHVMIVVTLACTCTCSFNCSTKTIRYRCVSCINKQCD